MVHIASRHADGRQVTKVYLKVGHLRQVVPSRSLSASSWFRRERQSRARSWRWRRSR
ncbi:MAG: hydrogenase maturation nickel metallochaperone HypA [Actinomycetota bacterium]|nr:hydrogenase maturation nickel metallochaperone HypA [Actinomycetota bacterium]